MRICTGCSRDLPLESFTKLVNGPDGLSYRCRGCDAERARRYRRNNQAVMKEREAVRARDPERRQAVARVKAKNRDRNREFVWTHLLSHPCVDCAEADPVVLQFDHLGDKWQTISQLIANAYSLLALKTEMAKCEVVCANCHTRRTAMRASHWRVQNSQES